MKYNMHIIITSISMEGGEIVREFYNIIVTITVDVVGHLICKRLDKTSPSGYWKTLHGVVKRSLIKK